MGCTEVNRVEREGTTGREGDSVILSPPYQDWPDYFENAPRVDANFRSAMAEMRRNPLSFETRAPFGRR